MSYNFRKKQYEQSAPIPAKFLMPDGSVSDTLPGGGGSGGSTSWNQVYSKPFNTISTDDFKVENNELKLKAVASPDVVFFNLPDEEDWEDETVTRPFYNQLKSAIDNGKYVIAVETFSADFNSWIYYTVAYNSVDSSEEDSQWINLTSFDGIYVDTLQIFPVSIEKTETEMKGEITIEFDKTDIASVANELFDAIANDLNPVLLEEVGHADYRWKFINSEQDESIGSITGYVFLCSKNGELHKLIIKGNSYQETIISNQASITTLSDWSSLKEGFNSVLISQGTVLGSFTAPNNLRGYFVKNDSEGNGIFTTYNASDCYLIIHSSAISGSEWRVKKVSLTDI